MQKLDQPGVTSPVPSNDFDIWRDYMNLGTVLEQLREMESGSPRPNRRVPDVQRRHQKDSLSDNSECDYLSLSPPGSISDTTRDSLASSDYCGFCKKNGEAAEIYRSHRLKSTDGRMVCPVLRSYTCPICEATGDKAHTRQYCPQRNRVMELTFGGL